MVVVEIYPREKVAQVALDIHNVGGAYVARVDVHAAPDAWSYNTVEEFIDRVKRHFPNSAVAVVLGETDEVIYRQGKVGKSYEGDKVKYFTDEELTAP